MPATRASQSAEHLPAGKAKREAKRRVGHPGRSNGSERRGGQLNRMSVLGHLKQDKALSRARPKGNYGGSLGKAKKLASTPAKPAKRKPPKEKSKAVTHVPNGAKPGEIRLP